MATAGYRVSVIGPKRDARASFQAVVDGIKVYRYPNVTLGSLQISYIAEYCWAMLAIAILSLYVLMKDGFRIIHMANPPDSLIPMLAIYRLFGKILIFDQHDLSPELYSVKFKRPKAALVGLLRIFERLSYVLADHVIVTNESYAGIARQRGHLPETKITVIRNGPDLPLDLAAEIDPALRSKAKIILAFGGATGSQDGLDNLCHILHCLRYELGRSDFYCIVMGDGDALDSTKKLAGELALNEYIWFTGWISEPNRYRRNLRTADICISPEGANFYNDHSTFVKIMEYMSVGKPIVAFDLQETRNSAQNAALYAKRGDLRDFANQITTLMDDPYLREQLGSVGRERIVSQLAWPHSATRLINTYTKMLGNH